MSPTREEHDANVGRAFAQELERQKYRPAANGQAGPARPSPGALPNPFQVRTFDLFRTPKRPLLVYDLMGHHDLGLVYGGWGSGKSYFAVDLACRIGLGEDWRFRKVDKGSVAYVAGEAPGSIEARIKAWTLRNRGPKPRGGPPPVGVVPAAPDLLHGDHDLKLLAEALEGFRDASNIPLRMVILDTLHACAPGSREDAGDTGHVLARTRVLMGRLGCSVVIVHHAGKDSSRGARGSNSLEAGADWIIEIVEDGTVRLPVVRKLRDGEVPDLPPFTIDNVTFEVEGDQPVRVGVHMLAALPPESQDKRAKALKLKAENYSIRDAAKAVGASSSAVGRWYREANG